MSKNQFYLKVFCLLVTFSLLFGCNSQPGGSIINIERKAILEPDYSEVTIPPNIAPLNFSIHEAGSAYFVKFSSLSGTEIEVSSHDGKINIPEKKVEKNAAKQYREGY